MHNLRWFRFLFVVACTRISMSVLEGVSESVILSVFDDPLCMRSYLDCSDGDSEYAERLLHGSHWVNRLKGSKLKGSKLKGSKAKGIKKLKGLRLSHGLTWTFPITGKVTVKLTHSQVDCLRPRPSSVDIFRDGFSQSRSIGILFMWSHFMLR